jgi:Tol biopolymer transport system component
MRGGLLLGLVSALLLAPAAGSATTDRYVLWSAKTAGAPAVASNLLPADLPYDTPVGAPADVLDRTTGGRVAVASLTGVVVENVDASARVVLPITGAYDGRFSPDGSRLVLASSSCGKADPACETLSIVNSDGTGLRTLATQAGAARWLGDRLLAFVGAVAGNGTGTLLVTDTNGKTMRVLGRSYAAPAPAPSPNGRLVADRCRAQLVCVRTATAPGRVVARFRGATVTPALWSPDGSRVGLTLAGNYTSTTAVGTVKSAALVPISAPLYIGTDDAIIGWSPDSRTILAQRRCAGGLFIGPSPCRDQVFSEIVATHARRRLTHDDLRWEAVQWTTAGLTYVTPPVGTPALPARGGDPLPSAEAEAS